MMNYLDQATYRKQKAALTRALNSGDPLVVLRTTRAAFALWNDHGHAFPDDWHRWNIAEADALAQLEREHRFR